MLLMTVVTCHKSIYTFLANDVIPQYIQEATSRLQITTDEDTRLKCRKTYDRGRNSTWLKKPSERKYNCYLNLSEIL